MFHPVNSRVNFPQVEEKILRLWKKNKVFTRSVEARRGSHRFVFYEGPPTINASPGIHHVLARVFKDVIPRYKTMKGYYAPRIAGWDTHGLPVELEVEKELGFSGKVQIEEYGVARFNVRCRENVFNYLKEWEAMTERIGFWVDLQQPYITMDNNYIETDWWAIKQMWDKGLVYQGYKVTPHCPRCGTSLSSHEVALGYRDDTEDPSVYIKFKLMEESQRRLNLSQSACFLAWTTTPWTLPGNAALAVAADAEYAVVWVDGEYLILAEALLKQVGLEGNKVVERIKGSELVAVEYEPLFNPHEFGVERQRFYASSKLQLQELDGNLTYRVIATNFVSMDEGTGIVHVAPAFGEADFDVGMSHELDFVQPVDLQGKITGNYPFSGKFVKEADSLILDDLKVRGLLFCSEKIYHTYPFCWRCEAPLLYYAKQTWYIKTTVMKKNLIVGNKEINWYPEHIKYGRFGDWLENNVDWAFSRERYWGTPLPIWRCENPDCDNLDCIGSLEELGGKEGFSGLKEPIDLHRPFVDEITYDCVECGVKMKRVSEVIDCWFDSGAMPIAQHHYPFENKALFDDELKQADYICEAVDQTRGWFYSLHAVSTLLFNRPSFKNVICLGHIVDAKGEKMSKAKGNVIEPWAVIDKYGADALRWYFFTSAPAGNVRRFSEAIVAEITRRFLSKLWNVYSFFVTYANIDHCIPGSVEVALELSELDRWIISEINQLIVDVDSALDSYNPTEAGRKIERFVDDLSNWYVRRSRRRFWKSENDADKLVAYTTLYDCLVTLSKLLAPFTPFLAEELYQNLVGSIFPEAPGSVHLADFPVADETKINKQLAVDTRLVMKVSSLGRAARSKAGIKVRQPLAHVVVGVTSNQERESMKALKSQIMEELNVKEIKFETPARLAALAKEPGYVVDDETVTGTALYTNLSEDLRKEGLAREIVHRLQTIRRSAGFDITDHIATYFQGEDYIRGVMADVATAEYIKQETLSKELVEGLPAEVDFKETYRLGDYDILLGVKKLV